MTLEAFRDILLTLGPPVYHYAADKQEPPYIVWHEFGVRPWHGDNRRQALAHKIQIDLYTEREYDPLAGAVEALLSENGAAFDGPVTDYDEKTKMIRLIYECEVVGGG